MNGIMFALVMARPNCYLIEPEVRNIEVRNTEVRLYCHFEMIITVKS